MKHLTRQTLKIFLKQSLAYKWSVLILLVSIIIASLGSVVAPIFYKDFFNVLTDANNALDKTEVLKVILFKILIVYFISWIFWRTATFISTYYQSHGIVDLLNSSFAYLHKHSISFFNNNFVGSLVKKVNRLSRSFEVISDLLFWDLLPTFVNVILIIIVLIFYASIA